MFKRKGILYNKNEFKEVDGFVGVVKKDYKKQKAIDSTLRTKHTMPKYDEFGDIKFIGLLNDRKLNPWTDHLHMLQCIAMGLGTHLGFRGCKEIDKVEWLYFKPTVDPISKLRQVQTAPVGGFDKTNRLSMNCSLER